MSSGFQICEHLKPNELCVRLRKYQNMQYEELFHEHVPKYRISQDEMISMLRALVVSRAGFSPEHIMHCFLNGRGRNPIADGSLSIVGEYPEPGVRRRYCGGDVHGWVDEVINPAAFRLPTSTQ
jgi:hypothetical protein